MNISYNWLKDLIEFDLPADELARRLTGVGLAVEAVHPFGSDFVLDIDLTSNRPDCLSHLGVAREIRVFAGNDGVEAPVEASAIPLPALLADEVVKILDPELCNRFTARIIKGVKVGPSPQWLVDRLEAIGERSIHNIADITNFVMHEQGQPMHSFDLDRLAGQRIVVRRAQAGESIKTLDDVERKLDGSMLAICDAEKPVAVAGIMGGSESSITEDTVNVLLEVAYFKRESVRATSRKLNLATEASYRFERGVDIENLLLASSRAVDLMCELAGGTGGDLVDLFPVHKSPNRITSPDISASVARLTGLKVPTDDSLRILSALGIRQDSEDDVPETIFIAPSWRHDLAIEEDLVEEVARHIGYESIRSEIPPAFSAGEYQPNETRKIRLRETLGDLGFDEAISYSFINTEFDGQFEPVPGLVNENAVEPYVTLRDSVIKGAVRMRPTAIPGLLNSIRLNFNHQRRDVKLFEIGKVFAAEADADALPNEQEVLALAITGGEILRGRAMPVRNLDFFDIKGAVEAALDAAGLHDLRFADSDIKHLRKGQSAIIKLGGGNLGYIGRLSDKIAAQYKFRQPVYVCEVNLQEALLVPASESIYRPLPKFPGVTRDVSIIANRTVVYDEIREAILNEGYELLRDVAFVDVYEGKGMAEDQRSITIRLQYGSDDRTLTENEVEEIHNKIVSKLEDTFGVKQRS